MSKFRISSARAAVLKAKTASLARPMPATRNADGSIIPRDKTGGAAGRQAAAAKGGAGERQG